MQPYKTFLLSLLLLLLSGCFALEEPEESTGQVVAPTLAIVTVAEPTAVVPTEAPTQTPVPATSTPEATAEAPEPTATEDVPPTHTPTVEPTVEATSEPAANPIVYTIDAAQSEVRFLIDEVLRGEDVTVVGITSNVAGQVAADLANPEATQVGTIIINARDFVTDNNFRNRAISNEILHTDEFELITFAPTSVVGLPDSTAVGESYTFQIVGELTITDQTQSVTFDATVTPMSDTALAGFVSAEILYADFNLTIPFSQAVAAISDSVTLEFEFVAVADAQ